MGAKRVASRIEKAARFLGELTALLCMFFAVVAASNGHFDQGAYLMASAAAIGVGLIRTS
jgi:hypothetical protein